MSKLRESMGIKLQPFDMGRLYLSKNEAEMLITMLSNHRGQ